MGTDAATVQGWAQEFQVLIQRVRSCFSRHDLRQRAEQYVRGLLGPVPRKNGWQLAEYLGQDKPYGLQRLLGRARWDADPVRDELLRYSQEHLLARRESGLLIVDETGFLKKGQKSVGVQRQYSGTAGASLRMAPVQSGPGDDLAPCRRSGRGRRGRQTRPSRGTRAEAISLASGSPHLPRCPPASQPHMGRDLVPRRGRVFQPAPLSVIVAPGGGASDAACSCREAPDGR